MDTRPDDPPAGFPFDLLGSLNIDLDRIEWDRELKRIGALSGSVIGSVVSSRLSFSLGMRIVSVVGGSYSGVIAATLAYEAWCYLNRPAPPAD